MTEWFVYSHEQYYPSAEIVEAESPEEAARLACGSLISGGVVVLPASAIAWVHDNGLGVLLDSLRADGRLSVSLHKTAE